MFENYSIEASVVENGKQKSGMLMIFEDEYVFGGKSYPVDWGNVSLVQGSVKVKSLFRTVDKPSLKIQPANAIVPELVLDQPSYDQLVAEIEKRKNAVIAARAAAEASAAEHERKRREAEEEAAQKEIEQERIREEARRQAEEEYRLAQEAFNNKQVEKNERIEAIISRCKSENCEQADFGPLAKKSLSLFLDNPYRILGIPCTASAEDANASLDKLKKLARLKAVDSYSTPFDIQGVERPNRSLSVAQNSLALIKDETHRLFWFSSPNPCVAWNNAKYRMELERDGLEHGNYDLFLANYFYAVAADPNFETAQTWKRVFRFYCYLLKNNRADLIRSRFPKDAQDAYSDTELMRLFRQSVFRPVLALCDRDDLDATLRVYKYIQDCDDECLKSLSGKIFSSLTAWFNDKESRALRYLSENTYAKENLSEEESDAARKAGDEYCAAVEQVIGAVLKSFRADGAKRDTIKESYRHVTYQYMYELNKCATKANAIYFANKCFKYCSSDDKQRIKNTFGEANIKAVDWNIPHTGWDAKGDDFFFGRGCAVDYVQALNWYHKAADAGNMHSQNSLGLCYMTGKGVPKDMDIALEWFDKARKSGNPEGAYNLAECYYAGEGVGQNIDKALELWAEADKLGHQSAGSRREGVFAQTQSKRRSHRRANHICIDLGFQMTIGPSVYAEVTLSGRGYAYLVNAQGYQNYLDGNTFRSYGGFAAESPYRIPIPSSNHWYVIVDNGNNPLNGLIATAKVKNG